MINRIQTSDAPVLITGGAGFIGANLANRLLTAGRRVVLLDNLSRPGVSQNLQWLTRTHGSLVEHVAGDVRDERLVRELVCGARAVFHLAAQVAVTTSLSDPLADFDVNARGTLQLLEALRACSEPPPLLFTSTNKVYGPMPELALRHNGLRYIPIDPSIERLGIHETHLDFHSPYGCSKGCADQYVLDYARTYHLPTVVFRMSCIYGPHQMGTEDQGWIAHFLMRAMAGEQLIVFGDGMQVRDVLYIDDLLDAMLLAISRISAVRGMAFNIGGGPGRTVSLLELLHQIDRLHDRPTPVRHEPQRSGDQRYYVSDIRRFSQMTGWQPTVGVEVGVGRLHRWLIASSEPGPEAVAPPEAGLMVRPMSDPRSPERS
jgi:CDP-paratose 2-epimerase